MAKYNLSPNKINPLGRAAKTALDFILPPRCVATGRTVDSQGMIDPSFWIRLHFIENPKCVTCGMPFGFETGEDTECGQCLREPPAFDRARSALAYDDASRPLILGFKYGDRTYAAVTFAHWLQRYGQYLTEQADMIAPVPLHRWRLWRRRFNQSALLAQALGQRTGLPCHADLLLRNRATPQQKGLTAQGRKDNVRRAFAVNPACLGLLQGKSVILVDDVFTSGATLNECAKTLRKSGAKKVFALTLARVLKTEG